MALPSTAEPLPLEEGPAERVDHFSCYPTSAEAQQSRSVKIVPALVGVAREAGLRPRPSQRWKPSSTSLITLLNGFLEPHKPAIAVLAGFTGSLGALLLGFLR